MAPVDFEKLLAALPVAVAVWHARDDGELELVSCNIAARGVLGSQLRVGATYRECAGDYTGLYGDKIYRVAVGEEPGFALPRFEHRGRQVTLRVAEIGGGHSAAVFEDVSGLRGLEEQLKAKIDELERSNRDLEQFAYVASHDLLEPARMVLNFVKLFIEDYGKTVTGEGKLYLKHIELGAERSMKLINALLTFSRVGRTLRKSRFLATQALGDAAFALKCTIDEHDVQLDVASLPVVYADREMIASLFQNLVGNAIKFRREGRAPRVRVTADETETDWVFSVHDNGIGFDAAHEHIIFGLFKRLKTEKNGTGLGLAICKKIVECHGGKIFARSQPGFGSTFTFTLPKTETLDAEEDVPPPPANAEPHPPRGG